jgi:outer membrane receptor protein involved in Fe transport
VPFAACAQSASPESAQPDSSGQNGKALEEIVVTARRQSETLNRVPVAASAVTAATLANYNLTSLAGFATRVPGVSFEKTSGSSGAALTIRGLGSGGVDSGQEQTVAVNIDGIQVSRGQIAQQSAFDLEQVEILKGPQALFFGKNSPGGVISLRAKGPTDKFEAHLKAGYEFYAQETYAEGVVSGPLSDTLSARLAVRGTSMRGYMHNDAMPMPNPFAGTPGLSDSLPGAADHYNNNRELLGRLTFKYQPSPQFTATLRLFGSMQKDNRGNNGAAEITNCATPGSTSYFVAPGFVLQDPNGDCRANAHQSAGDLPSLEASTERGFRDGRAYGQFRSGLASLTADYAAPGLNFTSVTGYLRYGWKSSSNATQSVYPYGGYSFQEDKFRQFSQELRVVSDFSGALNFSAGLYYEDTSSRSPLMAIIAPLPTDPATGRLIGFAREYFGSGVAYSAFGQLRWNILEDVELAGGARWTRETRKVDIGNSYVHPLLAGSGIFRPVGMLGGKLSDSNISPEVTLSWHPMRNSTLYAAYKTGYKSGGFGAPSVVSPNYLTADDDRYQPEKARGGEIGVKLGLLDNRVRLTGAIYSYKLTNLQVSNFIASPPSQQTVNAGSSRTKGFEMEMALRATGQLTIASGISYSHARYISFDDAISCYGGQSAAQGCKASGLQDLSGAQLARAPDWSATASIDYGTPLSDTLKMGLSGAFRYASSYFTSDNHSPFTLQKSFATLDLTGRLSEIDGRWQVALIGRNVTNKRYKVFSLDATGGLGGDVTSVVARGRQIALELTAQF